MAAQRRPTTDGAVTLADLFHLFRQPPALATAAEREALNPRRRWVET
ncbi:hypothetical protein BN903_12 [Halorubrum sp. AJ67]|nr:hypothetical protein BN903_12 [Halorubrum sp. AJ67]